MYSIYDRWPEIAKNAYNSNVIPADFKNIEHIVFAGMGGSGALGDIFSSILSKTNVHVTLVKGYILPKTVNSDTLVITTSVSGNTIEKQDIFESIEELEILNKKIASTNLTKNNPSLQLAEWIKGIPMIYYPWGLQAAAIRFKNSLQENAKIHAIAEDVLEASHNGIVSWEKPSIVQPILLEGEDDFIKTKERWKILKEYFKENNVDYIEIKSIKGNILSKLITMIYLLDYTSIYHAVLAKIDPTPISSIDFIKKRL
jgi:glucose/mannose-6-phosphate isomerase